MHNGIECVAHLWGVLFLALRKMDIVISVAVLLRISQTLSSGSFTVVLRIIATSSAQYLRVSYVCVYIYICIEREIDMHTYVCHIHTLSAGMIGGPRTL